MNRQLLETAALTACALVLLAAALVKLRSPERTAQSLASILAPTRRRGTRPPAAAVLAARALGTAEVVLALALLVWPRAAAIAAAAFTLFAAVHGRAWRTGSTADCGCLGAGPTVSAARQALLTGASAVVLAAIAATPPRALLTVAASRPSGAVTAVLLAALGALGWRWAFTVAPHRVTASSQRLVEGAALFLERRLSRRTALVRLAVAGSALTVAPLRYLLYPGTALAAIVPGDCASGLCTDGYTAFCCEINRGVNACPTGTFPGGWWKCTDYRGRQLCREQGVRYYVDCNRIPGTHFPGGCRCAGDTCAQRRVACNVFRYGQCNPQVAGVTEVVCRMIVCENPAHISGLNCSAALAVDDATCGHEAPCLEPPAVEVGPAGGV